MTAVEVQNVAIDYDAWRARYDSLSFAEQQAIYDQIGHISPEQPHVDVDAANHAFRDVRSVVEIGGWRGELAEALLPLHRRVDSWVNFEVCGWAVGEGNRCGDARYAGVELDDWPWNTDLPAADLFVASHVVEHMRFRDFTLLAEQFPKFGRVHIRAPLPLIGRPCWDSYPGTHILEAGWEELHDFLGSLGLVLVGAGPLTCRTYERRGCE